MYASVAISSGLSEVDMSTIFFLASLIFEFAELPKLVVLELVELETEEGADEVEGESTCAAIVIRGLMSIKGDIIRIPIKNTIMTEL
jgi:hypothetical protein